MSSILPSLLPSLPRTSWPRQLLMSSMVGIRCLSFDRWVRSLAAGRRVTLGRPPLLRGLLRAQNSLISTLTKTVSAIDRRSDVTTAGSTSEDANPAGARRSAAPRQEGHPVLAVAVVGVVRVAAAGLREAAGEQVADGEDRGVEPDLPGAVAAGIRGVD